MPTCHVMFLRCRDKEDHIINWAVSAFDPPYCHVEWVCDRGYGCSVFQNETVFFKPRRYLNSRYETISLLCTNEQLNAMKQYCMRLVNLEVTFDKVSMYSSYFRRRGVSTPWCPYKSSLELRRTYCSKMVAEILKVGGYMELREANVDIFTPSELYNVLSRASTRVIDPLESRKCLTTDVCVSKDGFHAKFVSPSSNRVPLFYDSDGD
jgi:hypothetical protein